MTIQKSFLAGKKEPLDLDSAIYVPAARRKKTVALRWTGQEDEFSNRLEKVRFNLAFTVWRVWVLVRRLGASAIASDSGGQAYRVNLPLGSKTLQLDGLQGAGRPPVLLHGSAGYTKSRAVLAAERRQQREAQKRQRELERRAKDQAKLSAIEQARLEVETYENRMELLRSVHKEQGPTWDWIAIAAKLPPPCPQKSAYHELRAKQQLIFHPPQAKEGAEALIEQARLQDEREFQELMQAHSLARTEWEKMNSLSRCVLAGEQKAFLDALVEFSPLAEISDLGSSLHFIVHSPKLLECEFNANGKMAIPSEIKTLTATGKVSIRPMPKARFHEFYKDYICACMLRVTREVFAILPVETFLVTARVKSLSPRTGKMVEQPVMSAAIPRAVITELDFDRLDPSDAIENLLHRGNFKVSRRPEATEAETPEMQTAVQIAQNTGPELFETIIPLTPADLPSPTPDKMGVRDLLAHVRRLRKELRAATDKLRPQLATVESGNN